MAETVLISVFCPDRTGLIAAVTGELFSLGVNLGDTAFAVLGTGAEFNSVCELPEGVTGDDTLKELQRLPELADAEITVAPFDLDPVSGPMGKITHQIVVQGGDRPGLTARICETFVQFSANIVRMNSRRIPGPDTTQYRISFHVNIPDERIDSCLATISNTAGELGLTFEAMSKDGL